MSEVAFDVNQFITESKEVLVNPRTYFSTMKTTGGMAEPLIKAIIYGTVAGAIGFIWSLLNLGAIGVGLFGGSFGIMIIFGKIIGSIVGLFIGAVILLVISSICKGSSDFEANMRVIAAVMVIMPISAFFGFTFHINFYLGSIISLIISLFSLWLLYHGLVNALKANAETAKIVIYILIACTILLTVLSFGRLGRTDKILKNFKNGNAKEIMKDSPQNI